MASIRPFDSQCQTGEGQSSSVVGTVAYVSPEQAEGRKIDARSNISSFGSVLYEMRYGHRPFSGSSKVDLLRAVVHGEAQPLSDVTPGAPPELRIIIEKALEKDPADRYQSTRDLVLDENATSGLI